MPCATTQKQFGYHKKSGPSVSDLSVDSFVVYVFIFVVYVFIFVVYVFICVYVMVCCVCSKYFLQASLFIIRNFLYNFLAGQSPS